MTGVLSRGPSSPADVGIGLGHVGSERTPGGRFHRRGRTHYLVAAVCVAICTVMVMPLLVSVLASVKPTHESAQTPPTYVPHGFSLDAYRRLWEYQSGLPTTS